jgi:hypothetical protein
MCLAIVAWPTVPPAGASTSAGEPLPLVAYRRQMDLAGEVPGDSYGTVAAAGDVNGDGFPDVIVGAPNGGPNQEGRAYLYFGGPAADDVADLVFTGEVTGDEFGLTRCVGSAGDVNGDGFDDVIIGAPAHNGNGVDSGRLYLYFGGSSPDTTADWVRTGEVFEDYLGIVGRGADVNGDGYSDLIVAAPFHLPPGRAYVFFGGATPDTIPDVVMDGEESGDQFGWSISPAGDFNGDGFVDVVLGAPTSDAGAQAAGRIYIFFGGPGVDGVPDWVFTHDVTRALLGYSVSSAGDVNGDGFDDVIVGTSSGFGVAGTASVFFGGVTPDSTSDLTLTGEAPDDGFGEAVAGAGDLNGDGFADVVVGAPRNDAGGANAGRAYVYFGGPTPDALTDVFLTGEASDLLGDAVATADDTNRDGFPDVIAGARGSGRAFLYDFNRYFVDHPNGGELWNVGATEVISWHGAEPADVWLSVDGGATYKTLRSGVGGSDFNAISLLVPHLPTRFTLVKLAPTRLDLGGSDTSDSLFTIESSIDLLSFRAAAAPSGGVVLTWSTSPGVGSLSGYVLEKTTEARPTEDAWRTLVARTNDTSYVDRRGAPGHRYRLTAINGLEARYPLGEVRFEPSVPLAAWPLPYSGGELTVSFATLGGLGGALGSAEVVLHDVSGRLVRTIARGEWAAGQHFATWDGRDDQGNVVASGIYFLRVSAAGNVTSQNLVVVR